MLGGEYDYASTKRICTAARRVLELRPIQRQKGILSLTVGCNLWAHPPFNIHDGQLVLVVGCSGANLKARTRGKCKRTPLSACTAARMVLELRTIQRRKGIWSLTVGCHSWAHPPFNIHDSPFGSSRGL